MIFDLGFLICNFAGAATQNKSKIINPKSKITHGGEGGIRTHGGRKPTPVFETGALIHYATSPQTTDIRDQTSDVSLFFLTSDVRCLTSAFEKFLHQLAALRFKHAADYLNLMI